MAAWELLWRL
jgi:hypothetical protein